VESTFKRNNQLTIQKDIKYRQLIEEMKTIEEFIKSFGKLSFGRDYVLCGKLPFSLQVLITSVELTVGNIIACCECGCISDANTLLRKYRDDLFYYLYVIVYDSNKKLGISDSITTMEKNISQWAQNGLDNLYIQDILKQSTNLHM